MTTSKPWVRLYRDAISRPKVGRLSFSQLGFWAACLMLSDDEGVLPSVKDMAWTLRTVEPDIEGFLGILMSNGLVTRYVTDGVTFHRLHDWDEHQRKSDHDESGASRQRAWRERQKALKSADPVTVTDRNALRNAPVTLPDTDTEKNKKELTSFVPKKTVTPETKVERKGSRWPSEAVVPDDWFDLALDARARAGLPPVDVRVQAELFQNYWASKSGAAATKLDWKKTWINWCLNAKENGHGNRKNTGTRAGATLGALLDELTPVTRRVRDE